MGAEATENLLKGRISYRSQRQLSSTPTEKYLLISENVLEKRNPILSTIEAHTVVMWHTKSNWEKRKTETFSVNMCVFWVGTAGFITQLLDDMPNDIPNVTTIKPVADVLIDKY